MRTLLITILFLGVFYSPAQTPLLREGQAVFTFGAGCFSGGSQWSLLVYDVNNTYGVSPFHNWYTGYLYPHTADSVYWQADSMGGVFGLTIDTLGNIFAAATSIYSISAGIAGRGGIYKIDAYDWSVSPFIKTGNYPVYNPAKNLLPNTGSGLGDVCYDAVHNQLFVTNFEDGKIYRLDMHANILSVYDPFAPDPGIAAIADYKERVWAVEVNGNRSNEKLYFSRVTEDAAFSSTPNEIWSITLDPITGDFTDTAVREIVNTPPSADIITMPISDICFDTDGNLFFAERDMNGTETLAHNAGVFKCMRMPGFYSAPQRYYLGAYTGHDAEGGIAVGRKYTDVSHVSCEGLLWASCDAIKYDSEFIYGLTGLPIEGNSNNPSADNYYRNVNLMLDHDGDITDCIPKAYLGDVEIFKSCRGELVLCDILETFIPPNILTPNGDRLNDTLRIPNECDIGCLAVYDRWGVEVYSAMGLELKWDGRKKNGEVLPEGVYYCIYHDKKTDKSWYLHLVN